MNNLLKTEQGMQLVIAIFALHYQPIHFAWWQWPFLFLSPDLSVIGYLVNARVGAICYNIAHHKAVAGLLICVGVVGHLPAMLLIPLKMGVV
jgi:uncharacterized protein DUF4260